MGTDLVAELRKRTPHPGVVGWFDSTDRRQLQLSVLTIGELRAGVERMRERDASRAAALDGWLSGLETVYQDRIVPVDRATALAWGELAANRKLPVLDGLLAATAIVRDWVLVTRNVTDMASTGVRLLNPFGD